MCPPRALLLLLATTMVAAVGSEDPANIQDQTDIRIGYLTNVRGPQRGHGLTISGAISLAVDRINRRSDLLPGHQLQLVYADTHGDTTQGTYHLTKMVCAGVDAFFGPEESCFVEAHVAAAYDLPMFSYKCTDEEVSDKTKFPNFARTFPPETQVTKSVVSLLLHHNWRKFSIVTSDDYINVKISTSLEKMAEKSQMIVNHKKMFPSNPVHRVGKLLETVIQETRRQTQVYVLLGSANHLMLFISGLKLFNILNKHYVIIYIDLDFVFHNKTDFKYIWFKERLWQLLEKSDYHCNPSDTAPLHNLLVVRPSWPSEATAVAFNNAVRRYNEMPPFNFKTPEYMSKFVKHVSVMAVFLYDSLMMYAQAATALMMQHPDVPARQLIRNGTLVVGHIRNRTFHSVMGTVIKMDENGDSEGNFTVLTMQNNCNMHIRFNTFNHTLTCDKCMQPVAIFRATPGDLPEFAMLEGKTIDWLGGRVPLDEPPCGYDGSACIGPNLLRRDVVAAVMAIVLAFVAFVMLLTYRMWKEEQEIAGLMWRINAADLDELGRSPRISQSPSKLSLVSIVSIESRCVAQVFAITGRYKGMTVRIRNLIFEKKVEISRATMKEMRAMRDLRHQNINPFIGAVVKNNCVKIVSEYCPRGSLPDILEGGDMQLEYMFVAELILDLVKGMTYLHNSPLQFHGNLKSSNCVVTSRWVLKITDFGLGHLRRQASCGRWQQCSTEGSTIGHTAQDYQRHHGLLWSAPELLRGCVALAGRSTHRRCCCLGRRNHAPLQTRHQANGSAAMSSFSAAAATADLVLVDGSQPGDVYAFGIILREILSRDGPYGCDCGEPRDIVERVKRVPAVGECPFRPPVDLLNPPRDMPASDIKIVVDCMQRCWSECPEDRPTFVEIKRMLSSLRNGHSSNLVNSMMEKMEKYANNLEELVKERTQLLHEEKHKTEALLHRMLPSTVACSLVRGVPVPPDYYDSVTIYFSDIVGFTTISANSSPLQVVEMLNDLYTLFDDIIRGYDVYKVETIGDAYMVVSGVPKRNGVVHAGEIAQMALCLLEAISRHAIEHRPGERLRLRIGIHTGPVVAGVVGLTMPRYCLFGDTVNTASRLESTGEQLRIHISDSCKRLLDQLGGYVTQPRGTVDLKGRGPMLTHWLLSASDAVAANSCRRQPLLQPLQPLFQRITYPQLELAEDNTVPDAAALVDLDSAPADVGVESTSTLAAGASENSLPRTAAGTSAAAAVTAPEVAEKGVSRSLDELVPQLDRAAGVGYCHSRRRRPRARHWPVSAMNDVSTVEWMEEGGTHGQEDSTRLLMSRRSSAAADTIEQRGLTRSRAPMSVVAFVDCNRSPYERRSEVEVGQRRANGSQMTWPQSGSTVALAVGAAVADTADKFAPLIARGSALCDDNDNSANNCPMAESDHHATVAAARHGIESGRTSLNRRRRSRVCRSALCPREPTQHKHDRFSLSGWLRHTFGHHHHHHQYHRHQLSSVSCDQQWQPGRWPPSTDGVEMNGQNSRTGVNGQAAVPPTDSAAAPTAASSQTASPAAAADKARESGTGDTLLTGVCGRSSGTRRSASTIV